MQDMQLWDGGTGETRARRMSVRKKQQKEGAHISKVKYKYKPYNGDQIQVF